MTLPLDRLQGLEFALTALFLVLAVDAYRARPDRVVVVAAATCLAAAWLLVPGQLLPVAFAVLTGLLVLRQRHGRPDRVPGPAEDDARG